MYISEYVYKVEMRKWSKIICNAGCFLNNITCRKMHFDTCAIAAIFWDWENKGMQNLWTPMLVSVGHRIYN